MPTEDEIWQARSVLNRARVQAYWDQVKNDPVAYKARLIQLRKASKLAAKLRKHNQNIV